MCGSCRRRDTRGIRVVEIAEAIARVGQAAWQAVTTSPSAMRRVSFSAMRRAPLMRWTQ